MALECPICDDWEKNIRLINAPFVLQAARNPGYKGCGSKPFEYCPWCGNGLVEKSQDAVTGGE